MKESQLSETFSFSNTEYNSLEKITFEIKNYYSVFNQRAVFKSVKICFVVEHLECFL